MLGLVLYGQSDHPILRLRTHALGCFPGMAKLLGFGNRAAGFEPESEGLWVRAVSSSQ